MPANLPPVYHEAEARFRAAKTPAEKISALEEMLRLIPKHKGTDKLQGDIKSRLAKWRRQPTKKGGTHRPSRSVPRQGAGQVTLLGPPNAGKSSLVDRLTHAAPEVGAYPFTTRDPIPGMMSFENIAFQLIDLPPLSHEHTEPWIFDLARAADLAWLVVDVATALEGLEQTEQLLLAKRIEVLPPGSPPRKRDEVGWVRKPGMLVVTGSDLPGSSADLETLNELLDTPWPTLPVSCVTGDGLERLGPETYRILDIVRVYTKQPGKPADRQEPFTLPRGSTVGDLARTIHRDVRDRFKFARIWGTSVFDGQTVQREHVLEEGDLVEIHA